MSSNFIMTSSGILVPSGVIMQPLPGQTRLLAQMDGTPTDETGRLIKLQRGASYDTEMKKFGTSSLRTASNLYAEVPCTTADLIGRNDFTIDMWVYPLSYGGFSGANGLIQLGLTNDADSIHFAYTQLGYLVGGNHRTNLVASPAGQVKLNEWQHLGFTKNGTTLSLWHNGKLVGSSTSGNSINATSTNTTHIGYASAGGINGSRGLPSGGSQASGYGAALYDQVRVVKGIALFDSDFEPLSEPYVLPL